MRSNDPMEAKSSKDFMNSKFGSTLDSCAGGGGEGEDEVLMGTILTGIGDIWDGEGVLVGCVATCDDPCGRGGSGGGGGDMDTWLPGVAGPSIPIVMLTYRGIFFPFPLCTPLADATPVGSLCCRCRRGEGGPYRANVLKDMNGCSGVGRPGPGLRGVDGRTKWEEEDLVCTVGGALPDCIHGMCASLTLDTGADRSGAVTFYKEQNTQVQHDQ